MEPVFLTSDEVLAIHHDQVARYGGSPGLRDPGLLQSALAQPPAAFGGQFLHADLFEMAAAYLFHLVRNHAFVDGNKRVGTVAALVFLELNGAELDAPEADLEALVLSVAQGQADKAAVAAFIRKHVRVLS